MSEPYYQDEHVTLWHGDARTVMETMSAGTVDCIVTSPPYYGLRDYGVRGQLGAEGSPQSYIESLVAALSEARRILANDGTLWLNLGDSYSAPTGQGNKGPSSTLDGGGRPSGRRDRTLIPVLRTSQFDRAPKNLLGIPWRVALALQDDGWVLRNAIVWSKPNAMPESVTDRLSNRYEHIFLLAKSPRYWFNLDQIREERIYASPHVERNKYSGTETRGQRHGGNPRSMHTTGEYLASGRNPGDVWSIPTRPFTGAHFATFPIDVPERCILAGCKPDGTVLDPFSGSGTTGLAATKHGMRYVGIELNREYLELSLKTRLSQGVLDLWGGDVT